MKTNILKTLLVAMIMAVSTSASAQYFEVDGLNYRILSEADRTVEVTSSQVSGNLEIPEKIVYDSETYTVTAIGNYAFKNCEGLTSVTIPNSVTTIGYEAPFSHCSSLTEINVDAENQSYASEAGILYTKDKTILIVCPGGKKGEIAIPNSVTSIRYDAFGGCSGLTSVTIPNSVASIGDRAFYYCSGLTSVTIPNSVTLIDGEAFYGCSGLTSVTIPNSVIKIGGEAFGGCSALTEINVDAENQNYASEAGILYTKDKTILMQCPGGKKGEIAIPNSVTSIRRCAFYGCSGLTSVTIPNSVTSIGVNAFTWCSGLTSVTIPNSVTSIGQYAFYGCSGLTSVTIPNSITTIDNKVFSNCSGLTSVTIPNSVTKIGDWAFSYCNGLTSVTIPNAVTSIGYNAFDYCESLKSIYCQWTEPFECEPFSNYVDVYKNAVLYVPVGCTSAYKAVTPWSNFLDIEEIDYSGVEDVADNGIDVKVIAGDIVVEGCTDMEVYSVNGQLMYRGSAGRVENLAPGIYVVRAGGKTVKAMVAR